MRTKVRGNVLDVVTSRLCGAVLANNEPILGSIATPDVNGAAVPAFIVVGDATNLFPIGRTFTVTGGSNPGSYTVLAPGAVFNTFPGAPHIANTTEIPAAVAFDVAGPDGTMSGYGIDLDGTIISNSGTPVNAGDLASKSYVDGSLSSIVLGPANLSPSPPAYNIDISGSAAQLGGQPAANYLRSDISDTTTGNITMTGATRAFNINDPGANTNPSVGFVTGASLFNNGALVANVNSVSPGFLILRRHDVGNVIKSSILLYDNGNITIDPTGAGVTTNAGNFNVTGAIVATGNITAFSDIRLKKNIKTIDNAMAKIVQIGGYTYTRSDLDDAQHVGVIAQEIQQVLPEAVVANDDGMLSVAYGNLVALLIEGMKEQKKEIDDLKKRLDKVEE